MSIRKEFLKVTGLTYDIDEAIKNLKPEEKEDFRREILWCIPAGEYRKTDTVSQKEIDDFIAKLDEALGNSSDPDTGDSDGDNDEDDNNIIGSVEDFNKGGDLEITSDYCDFSGSKPIVINNSDKETNLTISSNVSTKAGGDFIKVDGGANVTVKGKAEIIESGIATSDNGSSVFVVNNGNLEISDVKVVGARAITVNGNDAKATINSGEFDTYYGSAPSIYVGPKGGKITIKDGTFGVLYDGKYYGGNKYVLNLYDALLKDGAKATDFIEITGGKFIGFDPAKSESENPIVSFVADGYESVKTGTVDGMVGNKAVKLDVYEVKKQK